MASHSDPIRPSPDALLRHAKREGRGQLKIFLGAAPGVGKTYEMLATAPQRPRRHRCDVVVGWSRRMVGAETRGAERRRGPAAHADRASRPPADGVGSSTRRSRAGHSSLLVDEYAHSNAPGSRHPKRWQDVEELLAAGIDVWTTLNVQHLESLVDVVWKITGVRLRETVPDGVSRRRRDRGGRHPARRAVASGWRRARSICRRRRTAPSQHFFKPGEPDGAARAGAAPRGARRWTTSWSSCIAPGGAARGLWAAGERDPGR